jgi:branched-chain amino acid transport system ATP-binding protein
MSELLLQVTSLSAGYGAGLVLENISFAVAPGASMAVLGRNGVGKSTLMLSLAGHVRARPGSRILFRGADITHAAPHERTHLGLAWVPQEREVFPSLTVDEHLRIAVRPGKWNTERVYALFPRLAERRRSFGGQLSGGEQQMLALGRALVTNPSLLLLDEPLEGLAPVIVKQLAQFIREIVAAGEMAILLVEQHTKFALRLTERALVLDRGQVAHAGTSADLLADGALLDRLIGMRKTRSAHTIAPAGAASADDFELKLSPQEKTRAH